MPKRKKRGGAADPVSPETPEVTNASAVLETPEDESDDPMGIQMEGAPEASPEPTPEAEDDDGQEPETSPEDSDPWSLAFPNADQEKIAHLRSTYSSPDDFLSQGYVPLEQEFNRRSQRLAQLESSQPQLQPQPAQAAPQQAPVDDGFDADDLARQYRSDYLRRGYQETDADELAARDVSRDREVHEMRREVQRNALLTEIALITARDNEFTIENQDVQSVIRQYPTGTPDMWHKLWRADHPKSQANGNGSRSPEQPLPPSAQFLQGARPVPANVHGEPVTRSPAVPRSASTPEHTDPDWPMVDDLPVERDIYMTYMLDEGTWLNRYKSFENFTRVMRKNKQSLRRGGR